MLTNRMLVAKILVSLVAIVSLSTGAYAAVYEYVTPATATNGGPLSATALFEVSDGQIDITLKNLQVDPNSVGQCLSGISFKIKNYTIDTGNLPSITGALGYPRTVNSDRTYTDAPTPFDKDSISWQLEYKEEWGGEKLAVHGPSPTIIGPPDLASDTYANANRSIKGNDPHNPFLMGETVLFTLSVPGLIAPPPPAPGDPNGSLFECATFIFGTNGFEVPGTYVYTPEPGTLGLLAAGGIGLLVRRNRRKVAV